MSLNANYIQGFNKTIAGFNFQYHSPIPSITNSIIVRAEAGYSPIEWETEIVPAEFNGTSVIFFWIYSTKVGIEEHKYSLSVNGKKILIFDSPQNNEKIIRKYEGMFGSEITFKTVEIDKYKDEMGFAFLTLPVKLIELGKPVAIQIDNENKILNEIYGCNTWYMTYKGKIEESVSVSQQNVVLKNGDASFNILRFEITRIGDKVNGTIQVEDIITEIELNMGNNVKEIRIPKIEESKTIIAILKIIGISDKEIEIKVKPIKEWNVYMVQHSHTDIGYTRPQTEILPEHLRYIDYALDYCDLTDDYPENAKFRWTCESAWAVREYLRSRPDSQIEKLIKRIKEGRIEVTGMFFNFSEIVDESCLIVQSKTIKEFSEKNIAVNTLMQNDVNGIGWCLVDYYANTTVKYLIMGEHGHRARIPFLIPTVFWWESPSGKKLLAYRSEHYMHGNVLGIISNDMESFRKNLSEYITDLEKKNYPFEEIAFQFSGYIIDNAPPSTKACDLVREWNEKYEWPKLRLAVANEFMKVVETKYSDQLPNYRVAWPDWWTDGFGSALRETQEARNTQVEMIANTGLLTIAKLLDLNIPQGINKDIDDVYDALLFYDEHTFGAAESVTNPSGENSIIQWNEKSAFIWDAVKKSRLLREKIMGSFQPYILKSDVPTIVIFNTLNWRRTGLVTVFIDHQILPENRDFKILDYNGNEVKTQKFEIRLEGTYWGLWVRDLPAMGYRIFRVEVGNESRITKPNCKFNNIIENEFYKIILNKKGLVKSIFDKQLREELLDKNSQYSFGEFIYEELENRHQLERFTSSKMDHEYKPLKGKRGSCENLKVEGYYKGDIWDSLHLKGNYSRCMDENGFSLVLRVFKFEKKIEIQYSMNKLPVNTPEAVYISFPFKLKNSKIKFEAQGGIVAPGENQLEGTSSDWNTIQNFASVRNEKSQIVLVSKDVPLVQFGEINTGRFYYQYSPKTTHIYSWVLNNYWTTNFKVSQKGQQKWCYTITSSINNSTSFATQFGWENRVPLLTRVFPAGKGNPKNTEESTLNINEKNLILVNTFHTSDEKSVTLLLKEVNGVETKINLNSFSFNLKLKSLTEVNLLDQELSKLTEWILFKPNEAKFIRIKF